MQFFFCDRQSVAGFIFGSSGAAKTKKTKNSGAPVCSAGDRKKDMSADSKLRESEVCCTVVENKMKYMPGVEKQGYRYN